MSNGTGAAAAAAEKIGVVVIHGVGETQPGWINDDFIPELEGRANGLGVSDRSEVYRLADPGRITSRRTHFHVFTRRAQLPGNRAVTFVELFWADLSRVGENLVARLIAMLQLFYESPLVLGHAFLPAGQKGGLRLLRFLILAANWILRWPLTGINASLFVCALVVLAMHVLGRFEFLKAMMPVDFAYPAMLMLALLAIGALAFGNWRLHRDIALADIGFSTAVFSTLLFAALLIEQVWTSGGRPGTQRSEEYEYLYLAGEIFIFTAFLWTHVVTLAIVVFLALFAWRTVSRSSIPLTRPAAALGLTALQAMVWKIVISALWFLLVAAVVEGKVAQTDQQVRALTVLKARQLDLFHVVVFNVGMLIVILAVIGLVVSTRYGLRTARRKAVADQRLDLPRLIVSQVVIVTIFALTLFNYYSFFGAKFLDFVTCKSAEHYSVIGQILVDVRSIVLEVMNWGSLCGGQYPLPFDPFRWADALITRQKDPTDTDVLKLVGTAIGGSALTYLGTYFRIANTLQSASTGVLHIARDIVDHQYTPRYAGLNRMLVRSKRQRGYPRRERIRKRLDEMMERVVSAGNYSRLVFVAHSQGSVILHDYLRTSGGDDILPSVKRIDVVTLGSPLSHLYRHYFRSYDATFAGADRYNPKVKSWTNLWRIDDPIGHRIDLFSDGFIKNETLKAGGHTNYWRDGRVCEVILDLIDAGPGAAGDTAGTQTPVST